MNEKQASVAARIAELSCLPMAELWTVWDRYFPRRQAQVLIVAMEQEPRQPILYRQYRQQCGQSLMFRYLKW